MLVCYMHQSCSDWSDHGRLPGVYEAYIIPECQLCVFYTKDSHSVQDVERTKDEWWREFYLSPL